MKVDILLDRVTSFVTDPLFLSNMKIVLMICLACFLLGCLLRLVFGKRGTTVRSVTVALGLLITYILSYILTTRAQTVAQFLSPLPFVQFDSSVIQIFTLEGADKNALCYELINLIMLAFLFGLMDDLLPAGKNIFSWILLRCICICGAYLSFTIVNMVFTKILPSFILTYAPVLLLILLAVFLAVTVFKWLIGLILGVSGGPVLGAVYTFFISHIVGKQLTKSALSTGILYLLVYLANHFHLTSITGIFEGNWIVALTICLLSVVWFCIYKLF
jgi:hypothetical protein